MKIWEFINQIKGTTATKDEILNWMVVNRICPVEVSYELDEGEQQELEDLAHQHCAPKLHGYCSIDCYREFLERVCRRRYS